MEAAPHSYTIREQRLLARFPCNLAGSSARCTIPLKCQSLPGKLRTCPQNLAPAQPALQATIGIGDVAWECFRASAWLEERAGGRVPEPSDWRVLSDGSEGVPEVVSPDLAAGDNTSDTRGVVVQPCPELGVNHV